MLPSHGGEKLKTSKLVEMFPRRGWWHRGLKVLSHLSFRQRSLAIFKQGFPPLFTKRKNVLSFHPSANCKLSFMLSSSGAIAIDCPFRPASVCKDQGSKGGSSLPTFPPQSRPHSRVADPPTRPVQRFIAPHRCGLFFFNQRR